MIRQAPVVSFSALKNRYLSQKLFGTFPPDAAQIEKYLATNAFYFAYLHSLAGGLVYLQALLKVHEEQGKVIDICTPDLGWVVALLQERRWGELQGMKELEIHFEQLESRATLQKEGIKIRVFCPGVLSDEEFRQLIALSGEFVGVQGDQSFSEAVSANKVYFYDARPHAEHFMRDLAALAENRIGAHRGALILLRTMRKAMLHHLPPAESEWVEESHFEERESPIELGLQVGLALQDSNTMLGMKRLDRILCEEYSANDYLGHVIQRSFCHLRRPDIARIEEKIVEDFCSAKIGFSECFFRLQEELQLEKKPSVWKIRLMESQESHRLHERLGKALRSLLHALAHTDLKLKGDEIQQIAKQIGGSLAKETDELVKQLQLYLELSRKISEKALHIEQETREI
ncbi:MAG: hypothetical protein HY069_04960 [Chlamydiia bacterium]|nr:hypothetical protein [Chlamydiia bacterium]